MNSLLTEWKRSLVSFLYNQYNLYIYYVCIHIISQIQNMRRIPSGRYICSSRPWWSILETSEIAILHTLLVGPWIQMTHIHLRINKHPFFVHCKIGYLIRPLYGIWLRIPFSPRANWICDDHLIDRFVLKYIGNMKL